MSIKILGGGLPVVGYAKIGTSSAKSSKLRGAPMKFDHIEITGRERDADGVLVPDVAAIGELLARGVPTCGGCDRSRDLAKRLARPDFAGGLPTSIEILLPYDEIELNLPNRLAYYRARTAYCVGDGVSAMRLTTVGTRKVDGKDVDVLGAPASFGPCGSACPDFGKRCKPHAKLRFMLASQESVGGCYEFATTSWNSLRNLRESLELIRTITRGTLAWIPLRFSIAPQTVQPKDGGPANTAWIARVTFEGTPTALLASVRDALAIQAPIVGEIRRLEASLRGETAWTETPEEIEAHVREYGAEDAPPAIVLDAPDVAPEADEDSYPEGDEAPAAPAPEPSEDATGEELGMLGAAAKARAEELFEQAATAERPCAYASPDDLDRALKSGALEAFALRGRKIPRSALAPVHAYFAGSELDPKSGKLVPPVSEGPF